MTIQQRMQATQDQMQRPDALPAVWELEPGMRVRAQLLQWLQRLARVQGNVDPDCDAPRSGQCAI